MNITTLTAPLLAVAIILFEDYKTTTHGIFFGLAASTTYISAARIFRDRGQEGCGTIETLLWKRHLLGPVTLIFAIGIATILYVSIEHGFDYHSIAWRHPVLLAINLMSATATIVTHVKALSSQPSQPLPSSQDGWSASAQAIVWVGLAILANNVLASPGYVTGPQLAALVGTHVYICFRQSHKPAITTSSTDIVSDEAISMQDMSLLEYAPETPTSNKYARLSLLLVDSNESEDMGGNAVCRSRANNCSSEYTRSWIPAIVRLLLLSLIWTAVFAMNSRLFANNLRHEPLPSLNLDYRPKQDMEIVISMCREDVDEVASMLGVLQSLLHDKDRSVTITIYTKDSRADTENLTARLGATRIFERPNVGREGETYLHHIISQWDNLARHTLFLQAHVHNMWEVQRRIETYFQHDTGALMLGFTGHTCRCDDCSDRWGWNDGNQIGLAYARIHKQRCSEVLLSYKGQFIASGARLRGIDRAVYEDLHRNLVDEHAWTHTAAYLHGRPDSLNAPYFGYTVERLWSVLLQCSSVDIALKCPTLLAGTRRGGDVIDCQCLDAERRDTGSEVADILPRSEDLHRCSNCGTGG